MRELHDGTKVRQVVERDRQKEKREYQIFLIEQEKARRLEALYWTVTFPYVEIWDETSECYYYYNEKTEESMYEKPTYTIDQENNVYVLQKWCRHLKEMKLMKEWNRKYALEEKERHLQAGWDLKQEERERYVTITLDVVDAEKGYMIQLGVRPTVNMHSVKHPKAKTLKQLKDQYERLQDYGK